MNEEAWALVKKAGDSTKAAELLFDNDLFGFGVLRAYYAMLYLYPITCEIAETPSSNGLARFLRLY